ncbi:MAG TPA: glucose-6-phosphate isomerase, partial [Sphingomicrobium sp.]|nr:glucose-6-phosphate isomerase [Sphingomicrobium sp.]
MPISPEQWTALEGASITPLAQLFADDPDRAERLSVDVAGITFDFAKTHLSREMLDQAGLMAKDGGLREAKEALFTGAIVNPTEGRAAEHLAERGTGSPDAVAFAGACHSRMRALVDAVEAGAFGDVTGLLHIGIGGSALGPDLLIDALGRGENRYKVEVLSNIDGQAFDAAVADLDPATTLVVIASKTFSTAETLQNARSALVWLEEAGVADPYGKLIGITAAPQAAVDFGIDETRVLPFGESVGGRYSLWSTIGFVVAVALGYSAFEELLEGAAEMDRHFRFAEDSVSAPVLAALSDLFYAHRLGC